MRFVKIDGWNRPVFEHEGRYLVDVEGELYTMTDEGEPLHPTHIESPLHLLTDEQLRDALRTRVELVDTFTGERFKVNKNDLIILKRWAIKNTSMGTSVYDNLNKKLKGIPHEYDIQQYIIDTLAAFPDGVELTQIPRHQTPGSEGLCNCGREPGFHEPHGNCIQARQFPYYLIGLSNDQNVSTYSTEGNQAEFRAIEDALSVIKQKSKEWASLGWKVAKLYGYLGSGEELVHTFPLVGVKQVPRYQTMSAYGEMPKDWKSDQLLEAVKHAFNYEHYIKDRKTNSIIFDPFGDMDINRANLENRGITLVIAKEKYGNVWRPMKIEDTVLVKCPNCLAETRADKNAEQVFCRQCDLEWFTYSPYDIVRPG